MLSALKNIQAKLTKANAAETKKAIGVAEKLLKEMTALGKKMEETAKKSKKATGSIVTGFKGVVTSIESLIDSFMLGEIAAEEGRAAEASRYLRSLWESEYGWYGVLVEARVYAEVGEPQAARDAYEEFLELWSEAPADHPFVIEARGAISE